MKKIILLAAVAAFLAANFDATAQTATNAIQSELGALVDQVKAKIMAGKDQESDFTGELKQFDTILAEEKGAKTDEAAGIVFMKAQLYLQIFNNPDKAKEFIQQIKTDYPDTQIGQKADEILASVDQQAQAEKAQAEAKKKQDEMLGNGMSFPDFAEKDSNGNPLSVGALKGKVVLVDFWATWCGPCRGELPNVIATYKKHHADGFEIIGVSLDSDRDKLDSFLKEQDGMTWPQYFDGQGWSNKLAVKYGVEAIPFAVLVGKDGKIVGKNLRGDELEAAVTTALAQK